MVSDFLQLEHISKSFGTVKAVDDFNLSIEKGEFFALLGASGCGKSTLLRVIAGLDIPDEGRIILNGQDITDVPPYRRPVNMMFQSYALFPHMNVFDNVAFGLKQESVAKHEVKERTMRFLKLAALEDLSQRKPHQLSGGQRQRVALARALVKEPKILLLDEPLAALDKKLRESTQFELMDLQEKLGLTFIVVTHDQEEAMVLSTRMGIMNKGKLEQIDKPRVIYEMPKSRFVADFIGSVNVVSCQSYEKQKKDMYVLHCEDLSAPLQVKLNAEEHHGQHPLAAAIRPEKIKMYKQSSKKKQETNMYNAKILDMAYTGNVSHYIVQLTGATKLKVSLVNENIDSQHRFDYEEEVIVKIPAQNVITLYA